MAFGPSEPGSNPGTDLAFFRNAINLFSLGVGLSLKRTTHKKCYILFLLLSCFLSFKHCEYINCIVPMNQRKENKITKRGRERPIFKKMTSFEDHLFVPSAWRRSTRDEYLNPPTIGGLGFYSTHSPLSSINTQTYANSTRTFQAVYHSTTVLIKCCCWCLNGNRCIQHGRAAGVAGSRDRR